MEPKFPPLYVHTKSQLDTFMVIAQGRCGGVCAGYVGMVGRDMWLWLGRICGDGHNQWHFFSSSDPVTFLPEGIVLVF